MKYKQVAELAADLRELADFIERKGHKLPISLYSPITISEYIYKDDDKGRSQKEQMVRIAKTLGKADKEFGSDTFKLVRNMTHGHVRVRFETSRESVCTKKLVKTEKVPKQVFVTIPNEFEDKPIYEWECTEPLLK
jgi:hypothetical protein